MGRLLDELSPIFLILSISSLLIYHTGMLGYHILPASLVLFLALPFLVIYQTIFVQIYMSCVVIHLFCLIFILLWGICVDY